MSKAERGLGSAAAGRASPPRDAVLAAGDVRSTSARHVGYYSLLFGERVGTDGARDRVEPQPTTPIGCCATLVSTGAENVALFVVSRAARAGRQMLSAQTRGTRRTLSLVNAYSRIRASPYSSLDGAR
jgi:hypothetical protein